MVHVTEIEFVLDWLILIVPLIVFIIFILYIKSFVPGEGKKIFMLLTIFTGVFAIHSLAHEGLEIAHFLGLHKGPLTEELEEIAEVISHTFEMLALGILFYIAVLFRNFTKKIEKVKK